MEAYLQGTRDFLQKTAVQTLGATSFLPYQFLGPLRTFRKQRQPIHPSIHLSFTHSLIGQQNTQVSKTGPVSVLRELLEGQPKTHGERQNEVVWAEHAL